MAPKHNNTPIILLFIQYIIIKRRQMYDFFNIPRAPRICIPVFILPCRRQYRVRTAIGGNGVTN
ncbi:hypothetical protein Barb4_04386 [Bacteroidales bacterium Barb4]|nr:hypothetical protein Barb4_04386 [Bacteroidales bacterium Barb4]